MPIHVVHIIWNIDVIGGAERMVVNIASGFKRYRGGDLSVISICGNGESHYSKILYELGIKLIFMKPMLKRAFNPEITFKLMKILKNLSPDIIHTHLWGASFHGFLCAKLLGKPIITHEHNVLVERKWFWNVFDRLSFGFRNKIIACSWPVYFSLLKNLKIGANENNMVVIENCINENQLLENTDKINKRKELEIDKDDFVFINVGSLTEQKGQKYLIEAFYKIFCEYKNVKLIIVGDGRLRKNLEHQTNKIKLSSKIRFLGNRKDIPDLLYASDVFVLSSLWEGLPMVLLETMYLGLVIIVTKVGVMEEIITEKVTGLLAIPGNVDSLYEKMKFSIENKEETKNFIPRAQNLVRNKYTNKIYINNLISLYKQILTSNK